MLPSISATIRASVSAALSTGELLTVAGLRRAERRRFRLLERRQARQHRGSRRRERTRLAIARLKAREADRRRDWIEKTSTDLARRFDLICVEDIDVRSMTRSAKGTPQRPRRGVRQKAGLNRGILASGFPSFLFSPSSLPTPRARGLAERPETSSLDTCRAVTRDATLARHEPSRATGRHASRRSAVALSAQVPPPSPLPGPARRLHATSRYGLAAVPGFSCPRLPAAVDATSRSAFRIASRKRPSRAGCALYSAGA